jgi:hypothetical protein
MFLSVLVSRVEPDGSLVVDLADDRGPVVRFGPLGEGMPWARLEGEYWVPTDHDYGVLLVNEVHERRKDLPIHRYLAGVPQEHLDTFNRLRYLQATVLALYARWPEARELLEVNPVLLWLLADRYATDPGVRHEVPGWLLLPQKDLLERVLGAPARPTQVRFLQKLALDIGDHAVLTAVRRALVATGVVTGLRHWPKVPAGLLSLFVEAPEVAELVWLREEAATTRNDYDLMRVVSQRRRLLRDTTRMIAILNEGQEGERFDIRRYRSARGVQAMHDRLIRAARQLGWTKLLDTDVSPEQAFPAPPISSDERFSAIANVAELVREGEEMHHCVVTRVADVMAGECALYQVNVGGERATLEVALSRKGEPLAIDEFRLACNAEPSEAAWGAAREWFERGQREWVRRNGGR